MSLDPMLAQPDQPDQLAQLLGQLPQQLIQQLGQQLGQQLSHQFAQQFGQPLTHHFAQQPHMIYFLLQNAVAHPQMRMNQQERQELEGLQQHAQTPVQQGRLQHLWLIQQIEHAADQMLLMQNLPQPQNNQINVQQLGQGNQPAQVQWNQNNVNNANHPHLT